jgi:hypothetical protein
MSEEVYINKDRDDMKVEMNMTGNNDGINIITEESDDDHIDAMIKKKIENQRPNLSAQKEAEELRYKLFSEKSKLKSEDQLKEMNNKRSRSKKKQSKQRSSSLNSNSTRRSESNDSKKNYNIEKLNEDIDYDQLKKESHRENSAIKDDYKRERSRSRNRSKSNNNSKLLGGIFDTKKKDDIISIDDDDDDLKNNNITKGPHEILREKQDILFQFQRLEKRGVKVPRHFTMSSDIDDLRYEFNRIKEQLRIDNSISFSRKGLMFVVSALEMMNTKYDPMGIELDGWSENIMDSMNEYDDIFEELYYKYKDSANMAPEMRLMLSLSGSAFMFHISNSMFKSKNPNINMQQPNMPQPNMSQPNMPQPNMPQPNMQNMMGSMMGNMMGSGGLGNMMSNFSNVNKNASHMRDDMSEPGDINEILKNTGVNVAELDDESSDEEKPKVESERNGKKKKSNAFNKIIK